MTPQPQHPRAELIQLVQTLSGAPSVAGRAQIAQQVGQVFTSHRLSDDERELAQSICEACAADLEVAVRETLSQQLCRSPLLPRELACRLAADVEAVAGPVLSYSMVLSDDDLLTIIEAANQDKLLAIAGRPAVSGPVGHALVERGDAGVVRTVLANPNAELAEPSLLHAVERFPDDEGVHDALVERPQLPAAVAARLITQISDALVGRLMWREDFAPEAVLALARRAGDQVLVTMPDQQAADVVDALFAQNKLTPMLLLRALVMRQRGFVARALARLARVPVDDVGGQLASGDSFKIRKLYQKAALPGSLFNAFNAVLAALREVEAGDDEPDQDDFEASVLARLAQAYPAVQGGDIETAFAEIARTIPRIERKATGRRTLH